MVEDHSGLVATLPEWPIGGGKLGGQTKCIYWEWENEVAITLPGLVQASSGQASSGQAEAVMGDELRILVDDPADGQDYLSAFNLMASELPDITIESESATEMPTSTGGSKPVQYLPFVEQ